jgi:hypothetical protein
MVALLVGWPCLHGSAADDGFWSLLWEMIGPKAEDAQELALATVATARGTHEVAEDKQPIALGGAIGAKPQSVDRSRALRLTWHGGKAPFRVAFSEANGGTRQTATADMRSMTLNLGGRPSGQYVLTIDAANDQHLSLRMMLVDPSEIPPAPELDLATTEQQKQLLQASWMLMRGGIKWRLEALSRLQGLADGGDAVAKSILSPPTESSVLP